MLRSNGQPEAAAELYRRMQKYDPGNLRAQAGLDQLEADARHRLIIAAAERLMKDDKYLEAQDVLRPALVENPQNRDARRLQRTIEERTAKPAIVTPRLKTTSAQPISLELRDVMLRAVFDTISRATGISFVFDKDVRADQRTTIVLRNASAEELIRLVLATNQLEQKVMNETTVLVFPNTPQKLREYQELVVKSFYLVNADVRQTANMIRALVKTRDLFIDEKLNLLVIKDTPNAVRLAERLILAQDLAEPEVMLHVEVFEIGSSRLLELGIKYPDSLAYSLVGAAGTPGVVSLPEWLNRGSELVQLRFSNPLFLFSLLQQDGSTNVLANPRIRVKNKEKARIHIGDRVPVITTTAAATGGFVSESVSYLDVGLKLEVEPLIYLDDEVGIKVGLEVSNIAREIRSTTRHPHLPDRHAQRDHRAAPARRRDPGARRPDQRRGPQDRGSRAGHRQHAGPRPPVLEHPRQRGEDRDRAAHHAAPGAHARAARGALGGVRRRHRVLHRFAAGLRAARHPATHAPAADSGAGAGGAREAAERLRPGALRRLQAARRARRARRLQATPGMKASGFTLIELVIAVAIVAVLASAALPLNELVVQRAKEQDLRRALREIRSALDAHKQACDDQRIPKCDKVSGASGYPKRLEDLVEGIEDQKNPKREKIYFLRRIPRDPFATDAALSDAATWSKRAYSSPPDDPRDGDDVFDVYTAAPGKGINGRPYKEW